MRKRFKVCRCSSATPDGKSKMGMTEVLRKKFEAGKISREELKTYASLRVNKKRMLNENSPVRVKIFGKNQEVPLGIAKSLNFKYEVI